MSGFVNYTWRGEPIKDIKEWCKEHKSEMVKYKNVKRIPNLFSGKIDEIVEFGEIPAEFFDCLRMTENSGMFFEISRYKIH